MDNKELLYDYMAVVSQFCVLLAKMVVINTKIEAGKEVEPTEVATLTDSISDYQTVLLVIKDRLGYTDGLSFLEDCKFRGFSLQEGKIVGLTDDLIRFVTPWIYEFPSSSTNNYKFEVGSLLIALAHEQVKEKEV